MGSSSAHPLPLFDEKVIFPVLERLFIWKVGNVTEIWDKQSIAVLEEQGSFCQLMEVNVAICAQLTHVFPSKMHALLKNLKELWVGSCGIMKGIVEFEGEIEVCFSKLSTLTLENLRNLESFSTELRTAGTTNGNATILAQPLFNEKVAFPALEQLSIINVPNITEIWDKKPLPESKKETQSFWRLRDIEIHECNQLVYVLPCYMLPQLQINLQSLKISECEEVEVIVSKEMKEKEATENEIIVFHQLQVVGFWKLRKLKSFYTRTELLFPHKVIFPVLEILFIRTMGNLTEIWDKQSIAVFEEQGSFCQLMKVDVANCAQLTHVFPSKMHALLKNLKDLRVHNCETMKGIVEFEGEIEVCFSKLSNLSLEDLPDLESFSTELRTAGTTNGNATILAQPFFNEKVAFPALEELTIHNVPNITEIWDKKPLSESEKETQSFWRLRDIDIIYCNQLVYVLPCYMLPQLQINLQSLKIESCEEVEVIVSKEKEATENEVIVFHQLKHVRFRDLRKLKSFHTGTELLFSHKVAFPSLESLIIGSLPRIKEIWPYKQPLPEPGKEAESFYKLSDIHVSDCEQLMYVFPFYILRQLQHLEEVEIRSCEKVEVIVSAELNDIIVFPQLKTMSLWWLPNLKRICSETQLFFSDKHAFPVLEHDSDRARLFLDQDLEFLRNGTSTKEVSMEECGTSGKENDHNGEED